MNADPFSITSKKIPRTLHEGHVDPYKIRYVSILPRIHALSIYIPRRRGSTATHAKTIHAPSTGARGSISDHIWIQSTSHPFRIRFGIISHHLC
uniref:Uncharacterized protein n=1 Tax=Caenorhabditis japonica TaxID=281687 RepID=A0A8R1IXL3_CAEJA